MRLLSSPPPWTIGIQFSILRVPRSYVLFGYQHSCALLRAVMIDVRRLFVKTSIPFYTIFHVSIYILPTWAPRAPVLEFSYLVATKY